MEINNSVAAARISALRAALKDKGIDAIVVLHPINVRYLSELSFEDGLLLITQNHAELITDFRYFEMAEKGADKAFRISMPENRDEYISKILAEDSVKTVGFEGGFVSYTFYKSLAEKYQRLQYLYCNQYPCS